MSTSPPPTSQAQPAAAPASGSQERTGSWRRGLRAALTLGALLAFAAVCIGVPVQAASLAASSASSALDSLSTSVGAFSTAVSGLSASSSPGARKVAQGDYRIERTQGWAGTPKRVALDLQPSAAAAAAGAQPWQLRIHAGVAASAELEAGQWVTVRERPFGFGLWRQDAERPFYLVVQDDWIEALQARPVNGR